MTCIVKYISAEYAAGRQIEEDQEIVKIMQNRSKNRVPRYAIFCSNFSCFIFCMKKMICSNFRHYNLITEIIKLTPVKPPTKETKEQPVIIKKTSWDPNLFQQPSYNPFEMKYRTVDSFPIGDVINKENMILDFQTL